MLDVLGAGEQLAELQQKLEEVIAERDALQAYKDRNPLQQESG